MEKKLDFQRTLVLQLGSLFLRLNRANSSGPKAVPCVVARKSKPDSVLSSNSLFSNKTLSVSPVKSIALEEISSEFVYTIEDESENACGDCFGNAASKLTGQDGHLVFSPILNGMLNPEMTPTVAIQHLKDLLTDVLITELDLPERNFGHLNVVLLIDCVFRRMQLRYLINLLLNELGFARVLVQLSSVCVFYTLKLQSAVIVDIGACKTSIVCVEDGVPLLETALLLPVGALQIINLLKRVLMQGKENSKIASLSECNAWTQLLNVLNCSVDNEEVIAIDNFQFDQYDLLELRIPSSTVKQINLLPFHQTMKPVFNQIPLMSSEPDDPFDDLYCHFTSQNKKPCVKKSTTEPGPESEPVVCKKEEPPAPAPAKNIVSDYPSKFDSLAEAIWWSINECGQLTTNFLSASSTSTGTTSNSVNNLVEQDLFALVTGEECRRRFLANIILTGGGACSRIIERDTSEKLAGLAENFNWIGGGYKVDVCTYPEACQNLAWFGGTLIASTNAMIDYAVEPGDWKKHGTRCLREKALFRW